MQQCFFLWGSKWSYSVFVRPSPVSVRTFTHRRQFYTGNTQTGRRKRGGEWAHPYVYRSKQRYVISHIVSVSALQPLCPADTPVQTRGGNECIVPTDKKEKGQAYAGYIEAQPVTLTPKHCRKSAYRDAGIVGTTTRGTPQQNGEASPQRNTTENREDHRPLFS